MKRLGSWPFGRPEAILSHEVIGKDDQLSHDGGQGDLFDLSSGKEALIKALEMRIEARRRKGRHIDAGAHLAWRPPWIRRGPLRLPLSQAKGSEPREHACLLGVETAEFGHVGDQSTSGYGSHAWNGEEDGEPAREPRIGFDALNGQRFERACRGFGALDLMFDLVLDARDGGGRELVSKSGRRRYGRLAVSHDFKTDFQWLRAAAALPRAGPSGRTRRASGHPRNWFSPARQATRRRAWRAAD